MYDKNGTITRAGAEQAIREGGSVLLAGQLHRTVDTLPGEEWFASTSANAESAALQQLLRQRQAIDKQITELGTGGGGGAGATGNVATAGAAGDDLDGLNAAELKSRAKAVGIEGADGMRKADLVEALRAAPATTNTALADQNAGDQQHP
jgi:hypothetical protein